ncbi:MAG: Transcriptional regulator [Parcubacteria group bacterium GW2011_GWA2_47_7]|nr:MAG: Transcriptional regulator [Parcubacteria group bacterium GW2011_GWA2_47_7]
MYSLHQTYFSVEKRLEHKLHEANGITFSQFLILLGLHCNARTSQSAIAIFLHITEATVSRHIAQLAEMNYLIRKEDPENRRKHILTMTPRGSRAFMDAHALIELELKEVFDDIPVSSRELITKAFKTVRVKLKPKP